MTANLFALKMSPNTRRSEAPNAIRSPPPVRTSTGSARPTTPPLVGHRRDRRCRAAEPPDTAASPGTAPAPLHADPL